MYDQWNKPLKRHCMNCGKLVLGFRSDKGIAKLQCKYCGLVMVGKRISRRHERVDILPPPGQDIES